jgi:hypothetical protein
MTIKPKVPQIKRERISKNTEIIKRDMQLLTDVSFSYIA